jgi:hypothetical protein
MPVPRKAQFFTTIPNNLTKTSNNQQNNPIKSNNNNKIQREDNTQDLIPIEAIVTKKALKSQNIWMYNNYVRKNLIIKKLFKKDNPKKLA